MGVQGAERVAGWPDELTGFCLLYTSVSLDIQKGEFVFLVGPSGSGKTTCIRMLLREELPDRGRIWVAGREIIHMPKWRVPYLRRNVGCVFQDYRLLPNKTVFQNVAFALEVIGRPKNVVETQAVSYTHLDVYKRQGWSRGRGSRSARRPRG